MQGKPIDYKDPGLISQPQRGDLIPIPTQTNPNKTYACQTRGNADQAFADIKELLLIF